MTDINSLMNIDKMHKLTSSCSNQSNSQMASCDEQTFRARAARLPGKVVPFYNMLNEHKDWVFFGEFGRITEFKKILSDSALTTLKETIP